MNVSDAVVRLRIAVFGCLAAVGVMGLWLAGVDGIRVNTPIVRTTLYCFLGALSMSALVWLIGTYGLPESESERTRRRYRFGADFIRARVDPAPFPSCNDPRELRAHPA
jgi:hypothetical protein